MERFTHPESIMGEVYPPREVRVYYTYPGRLEVYYTHPGSIKGSLYPPGEHKGGLYPPREARMDHITPLGRREGLKPL